ncbi:hypothetical protein H5410_019489 [Solanum commersonii]|uniref:Uncharacterized protein n=1 Tax=Solanum commersonii TaxID=4109 RepID=A0A9J5Z8G0_SOLCO|nr:hypothetical protein H5410_019489 [Solanum commersonii]
MKGENLDIELAGSQGHVTPNKGAIADTTASFLMLETEQETNLDIHLRLKFRDDNGVDSNIGLTF